jgi:hypothetical protein
LSRLRSGLGHEINVVLLFTGDGSVMSVVYLVTVCGIRYTNYTTERRRCQ